MSEIASCPDCLSELVVVGKKIGRVHRMEKTKLVKCSSKFKVRSTARLAHMWGWVFFVNSI